MYVDKDLLRSRFGRAANTYEDAAAAQCRAATHLLDLLARYGCRDRPPQRVLEIGCGTGLLTKRLAARYAGTLRELVLNDLAPGPALIEGCGDSLPAITLLPGDIERLALHSRFDLIISSSTLHWMDDLGTLLPRLVAALHPGGTLAFALYGPETLREVRALTGIGLDYLGREAIEQLLGRHCRLAHSSEEVEVVHFAAPREVLRHLRRTGVNALSRTSWNRARLEEFCALYGTRFAAGSEVVLTYHTLYFIAWQRRP